MKIGDVMYLAADERDCCTTFESDCVIAKVLPYFWMSLAGADGVIDVMQTSRAFAEESRAYRELTNGIMVGAPPSVLL